MPWAFPCVRHTRTIPTIGIGTWHRFATYIICVEVGEWLSRGTVTANENPMWSFIFHWLRVAQAYVVGMEAIDWVWMCSVAVLIGWWSMRSLPPAGNR